MANLARQLRQEQQQQQQTVKAPRKNIKQKKWAFTWGKNIRNCIWSTCLYWLGPNHLQSGGHL